MNSAKLLQLGTANKYKTGFINADIDEEFGKQDICFDLNEIPYPFENEEIDYITHEHTLEHTEKPEEVLDELYRILKKGERMVFKVPYRSLYGSIHKRSFNYSYFMSFEKYPRNVFGERKKRKGWHFVKNGWERVDIKYAVTDIWKIIMGWWFMCIIINRSIILKKFYDSVLYSLFPFDEMEIIMRK